MGANCTHRGQKANIEVQSYKLKIKKVIANGDYGVVYQAVDSNRQPMAVKYVNLNRAEAIRSFQRQIQTIDLIGQHENIVSVFAKQQKKEAGFIVMELAKMNIWELITNTMDKHLTETQVVYILRQIAKGLQHIHSKRCSHRSIKVENILIMDDGRVKICDFSNSSKDEYTDWKSTLTAQTENPQKSIRKSKRQLNKGYMIDQKMDMWMFGILAYILAFYQAPFRNIQQQHLFTTQIKIPEDSGASPNLIKFINLLLTQDHQQRMSAEEALEYLNKKFVLQL